MLIDSIIHAQQGCDSDMMFLVSKFSGILKKYARKLNYEDAEQDLTADFIELIHHIDIEKLNNTSDGAIVNFLIRSTYHYRTLLLSAPKNILTTVDKSGIKSYPFVCIVWTGVSKYKERNSANL